MRNLLLFSIAMAFCFYSQTVKSQNPEEISEKFFKFYVENGSDPALDYIFSTNKWLNNEKGYVDNVKAALKSGIAILGQYYGYELMEKKTLTESYVILTYMLKYDRQPIKFMFYLYKPKDKWQIQSFGMDDKVGREQEKAQQK